MKRCSKCNRTYSDDSLNYCLEDGQLLLRISTGAAEPPVTVPYSSADLADNPPPTEVFPPTAPTIGAPTITAARSTDSPPPVAGSSHRLLTAGVISIALLLLIITTLGIMFLFLRGPNDQGQERTAENKELPGASSPSRDVKGPATLQTTTSSDELEQPRSPLKIKVTASSVRYSVQSNTYLPENVIDGTKRTAWIEGADGPGVGEWLRFDFDREINLHRILILPGYFKSPDIWQQNNRLSEAMIQFSDGSSRLVSFPDRMERQTVDLGSVRTRSVKLQIEKVYSGSDPDTAISEVAFEWEP